MTSTPADPPAGLQPGDGWQRLDRRTVWASTVITGGALLLAGVPVAIALLLSGLSLGWTAFWVGGGVLVGSAAIGVGEAVRIAVSRFRIDAHRIERRVQFLGSTHTALALERVRNVEIAADLVQRWFGIAEVRLASGDSDGPRFKLQALDRAHAEALRAHLLGDRATAETGTVATLDPGWARYAPVTFWTPTLGLFAFGGAFQVADWFSAVPAMLDWFTSAVADVPLAWVVIGLVVLGLLIGAVATVAVFFEGWWGYRLERHDDGSLELGRGLVVNRATSIDGRRIRGVTLREPPGLRRVGAARLDVIAVGIHGGSDESEREKQSPALVPSAPRAVAVRVGEAVTGTSWPQELRVHPRAAWRRRLVRAGVVAGFAGVLAVIPVVVWSFPWWVPATTVLVTAVLVGWLAVDNMRGLGHVLTDSHVALRKGSLLRRTDVLRREGLLGWNVRRSPFQRRSGLATVVATSAGGRGVFRLPDVSGDQAAELMATSGTVWDHLAVRNPSSLVPE